MSTTKGADRMRGFVKTIFILCYVAFMYASIHKVAVFFNNFEASDDMVGSYLLAGAFDITALVTTIAVMFFRRSMPKPVFIGVWCFILAITGYSTFINWEYANHYQNMQLIMQATGRMIAVYDHNNVLHYVSEMKPNLALLNINPIIASAFTAFSLIYSIVAEFFGSKPPTATELSEKIKYLTDTDPLEAQLRALQEKRKGPGLITKAKNKVIEAYDAGKEVAGVVTGKDQQTPSEQSEEIEEHAEEEPTPQESGEVSKLDLALEFIQKNPLASDQMLMDYLAVDVLTARLWKTRALEVLNRDALKEEPTPEEDENVTSFQFEREKRKPGRRPGSRNKAKVANS